MLNEEKVAFSPLISQRIKNIHRDKVEINDTKRRLIGHMNFDDWGFVYHPEFTFTSPHSDREDGLICGYVPIGKTLRKF